MKFRLLTYLREDQRVKSWLWLLGGSLLVCLVVCFFFTPRFVIWRGLYIPEAWFNPEVNRAVDTLKQLQNPFVKIENPSNLVINWRLFFPLVGHWLHFPVWSYLMIPQIGCIIAVAYILRLVWKRTGQKTLALLAACTVASADRFFVSMGWLTYFDSWFVLGLLVVCFSPSRWAMGVMCLVVPWIDERFIFSLPVCTVARLLDDLEWRKRGWKSLLTDMGLIALLTLPYIGMRVALMMTTDAASVSYLPSILNAPRTIPLWRFIEGFWAGFRAAWLYLLFFFIWIWAHHRGWVRIAVSLIVCAQILFALFVAGDISRSMAMLLPVVLLGVMMLTSWHPAGSRSVLSAVLLANLLLPATHVVTSFKLPVYYLYHELAEWRDPPACVNPVAYVNEGVKLLNGGRHADAKHFFDNAIHLNHQLPEAFLGRGVANLGIQDFASARLDLEQALQLRPQWIEALHFYDLALEGKTGLPPRKQSDTDAPPPLE